jgi:hypothetical protein
MKKIRLNVFETNSSSTHVITINRHKDRLYDTLNVNSDGTVIVYGGQFLDGSDVSTPEQKASYIVSTINAQDNWDSKEYRKILTGVIKEQTGCENVIYCKDTIDTSWVTDYREIESMFNVNNLETDFRDFIFNPRSHVDIIDRNNEDYY